MGGDGGLRHVVRKRVHLERHQPAERKRFGFLEKHKDYVKRAKDFHRKEEVIKKLHRKAFFKNEDEFAFGMISHKRNKVGELEAKKHLSNDELRLLDSQDARYVGMREVMDRKAVKKQAECLHFLDAAKPNRHILFVEEEEEEEGGGPSGGGGGSAPSRGSGSGTGAASSGARAGRKKSEDFDAAHFDTHPALLTRRANRLRLAQLETQSLANRTELMKECKAAYSELLQRQERAKKLRRVREEMELRTHMRQKGRRKKVADAKDGCPAVYRWMPERKK